MKHLLKSIVVSGLLFSAAITVAQDQQMGKRSPQERAQKQVNWMQKNLALTDDQGKKAFDILFKYASQVENDRNNPPGKERRMEMREIQANRDAELKGILTGDQYQKYQAHLQEMKDKMKERRTEGMQDGNN